VKGIGKSTLVSAVKNQLNNFEFIVGSEILHDLVGEDFKNFDYFTEEKKQYYRQEAILKFTAIQESTKKHIVIDGHIILYNPKTKNIDIVFSKEDAEFHTDIVLYEANTDTIYNRRKNDLKKKRILDKEIIDMEIVSEKQEAYKIVEKYNLNFYIIDGNNFEKAQTQFISILRGEDKVEAARKSK